MNKHFTTKRIVMTALMAALTVAGSALRIKVPSIVGTSAFHLGNIMCALSGILLGPWLGGLASGLGSALYDILLDPAYISESWITLLTKGAYGLVAGLVAYGFHTNWHASTKKYLRALLATIAGALTYAFLYLSKTCFYSGMLMKGLTLEGALWGTLDKLPATTFNMAVAIVAAPLLAVAISKALKAAKLSLE
ncbi:MAG: ECF transporter S component [Oscillospiraceae bacterium]|nr:ECF transporter S component [Oscillospiraceae bacterium]